MADHDPTWDLDLLMYSEDEAPLCQCQATDEDEWRRSLDLFAVRIIRLRSALLQGQSEDSLMSLAPMQERVQNLRQILRARLGLPEYDEEFEEWLDRKVRDEATGKTMTGREWVQVNPLFPTALYAPLRLDRPAWQRPGPRFRPLECSFELRHPWLTFLIGYWLNPLWVLVFVGAAIAKALGD